MTNEFPKAREYLDMGLRYLELGGTTGVNVLLPSVAESTIRSALTIAEKIETGTHVLVPREPGEWIYSDKVIGHDNCPDYKKRMQKLYKAMIQAAQETK